MVRFVVLKAHFFVYLASLHLETKKGFPKGRNSEKSVLGSGPGKVVSVSRILRATEKRRQDETFLSLRILQEQRSKP
jgi:hypothetical protein